MSFAQKLSKEQVEHVKELYHNIECTRQDIANYLGICYNSVGHVLSYYGINTRENAGKKKHLQSLAPKCENVFLQETPETAYLLGYILGDGAISEVRHNLNFSSKDYQIMLAIASVLKFPVEKIYRNVFRREKDYICYQINLYDAPTVQTLIQKYGFNSQKSTVGCNPVIPEGLKSHYLRGLFDSDGCVRFQHRRGQPERLTVEILGHKSYIDRFITDDYSFLNFKPARYRNHFCGYMNLYKIKDVRNFYNYIYKDATIYLERKKEIFDDHYNTRKYNF